MLSSYVTVVVSMDSSILMFALVSFLTSMGTWSIMLYIVHEQFDRSLNRNQLVNNVAGKALAVIVRIFVVLTCIFGIAWLLRS